MFNITKKSIQYGAHTLTLETGEISRQADAAVLVSYGDTVVLVAVTQKVRSQRRPRFLPANSRLHGKNLCCG